MVIKFRYCSSCLFKLLFISMAAISSAGHAMDDLVSFNDDDYPCRGTLCMSVSPPPVLNPCGHLGDCSSSPTPHRRSKSAGQFGAAPAPFQGRPSLPPSVNWKPPPSLPPSPELPRLMSPAPSPAVVPVDSIAAPPTCMSGMDEGHS